MFYTDWANGWCGPTRRTAEVFWLRHKRVLVLGHASVYLQHAICWLHLGHPLRTVPCSCHTKSYSRFPMNLFGTIARPVSAEPGSCSCRHRSESRTAFTRSKASSDMTRDIFFSLKQNNRWCKPLVTKASRLMASICTDMLPKTCRPSGPHSSIQICIYIYICIHICTYTYRYIHIYIYMLHVVVFIYTCAITYNIHTYIHI